MSLIRRRPPVATDGGRSRADLGGAGTARPAGRLRRVIRGALVVAAGTAALSSAGPFALRPFADVAGAAGTVTVAFVLDFGGAPATLVTGCVTVPDTYSRYDALAAFTASKGIAAPSYAPSGLLCSIDGVPTSGCGQVVPGGYVYWSYFTGGQGAWSYASTGAFATVGPNDVEGWRFQDPGSGRPNDPAPRSTPNYRLLCPPVRPGPTAGTTSTSTTTATTKAPAAGHGPGAGGPPAHLHPKVAAAGAAGASAAGHRGASLDLIGSGGGSAPDKGTTRATSPSGGTSATTPDSSSSASVSIPPDPEVGMVGTHHVTPGSGPDPLIVGGLLVAVLAIAAWARWRRRPRTP